MTKQNYLRNCRSNQIRISEPIYLNIMLCKCNGLTISCVHTFFEIYYLHKYVVCVQMSSFIVQLASDTDLHYKAVHNELIFIFSRMYC